MQKLGYFEKKKIKKQRSAYLAELRKKNNRCKRVTIDKEDGLNKGKSYLDYLKNPGIKLSEHRAEYNRLMTEEQKKKIQRKESKARIKYNCV